MQFVGDVHIGIDQRAKPPAFQSGEAVGVHAVAGRKSVRMEFNREVSSGEGPLEAGPVGRRPVCRKHELDRQLE